MNLYLIYSKYSSDGFDHLLEMLLWNNYYYSVQAWSDYSDITLERG